MHLCPAAQCADGFLAPKHGPERPLFSVVKACAKTCPSPFVSLHARANAPLTGPCCLSAAFLTLLGLAPRPPGTSERKTTLSRISCKLYPEVAARSQQAIHAGAILPSCPAGLWAVLRSVPFPSGLSCCRRPISSGSLAALPLASASRSRRARVVSGAQEREEFANFLPCRIEKDGVVYPSAEHFFQAHKTLDARRRSAVAAASFRDVYMAGQSVDLRPDWEGIKLKVPRLGGSASHRVP